VTIASTSGSFASSADPAAALQTFSPGSHVDVDDLRAALDVVPRGVRHQRGIGAGDLHRDGFHFASMVVRRCDFSVAHNRGLEATISDTA
jgi:hypothetical protein